jgi:hypothetical protein
MTKEQLKKNLTSGSTWLRGLFMLLYSMIGMIAIFITVVVILFQFGSVLLTGKPNEPLFPLGQSLSTYVAQILLFLTYNTETKPFPLSHWPTEAESSHFTITRPPEMKSTWSPHEE